ncbi:MAG TPA: hypothetical protein PK402_05260 [Tepidisphaeraceae bacterium]|nr:hypothetical protein [Tepidisphaeraceae bacterium]
MQWQSCSITSPPRSNYERQVEFRKRNPGYYARLKATRRAGRKHVAARLGAKAELAALTVEPSQAAAAPEIATAPTAC